jgi:hypothetical protein
LREIIERVAKYVSKDGQSLENLIREREHANPRFGFLFDTTRPEARHPAGTERGRGA